LFKNFTGISPPNVTLNCTADYTTLSKSFVNATWRPSPDSTPESISDDIQDCRADITCDNGYTQVCLMDYSKTMFQCRYYSYRQKVVIMMT